MSDFHDLIDVEGLDPDEERRLMAVHDLLVQAGPPAELTPKLEQPDDRPEGTVIPFPLFPRRRAVATLLVAAAVAAAAFGGGYLVGHSKAKSSTFATAHFIQMHPLGAAGAGTQLAVLALGHSDSGGNWPMQMTVTGLPQQPQPNAYYELWLTKHGKPVAPCGVFRVHSDTTTVRFSVPYRFSEYDGWVVTAHRPGQAEPGRVVLTT